MGYLAIPEHTDISIAEIRLRKASVGARIVWLAPMGHSESKKLQKALKLQYED